MPPPKRTPWTSPGGWWIKVARVFAAVVALTVGVTLLEPVQANYAGSRGEVRPTTTPSARSPALALTDDSRGAHRSITVVGVGDSVTAGNSCNCEAFVGLYAADLTSQRGLKTSSVNLGVSGWTTSQLLTSLEQPGALRDQVAQADILLVTIWANDLTPLESREPGGCATTCYAPLIDTVGHNVQLISAAARAVQPAHPLTILVTNYWNVFQDGDVGTAENGASFQSWSDELTRAANQQICEGAQRAGASCVDLYAPFKGNGSKNPTSLLAADGDHPNSPGHQLIASALLADTPAQIP